MDFTSITSLKLGQSVRQWNPTEYLDAKDPSLSYAMIVLNCPIEWPKNIIIPLWNKASSRITVDGGTDRWLSYIGDTQTAPPNFVTGDMDSVSPQTVDYFASLGSIVVETPDQDEADFTKALRHLRKETLSSDLKLDGVLTMADTTGRIDHIFANVQTLFLAARFMTDTPVYLLAHDSISWLLPAGMHCIQIPGRLRALWCSLVPVGGAAKVETSGLKWNLNNQYLEFGGLVSTSNSYSISGPVTVTTDSPILWSMALR